MDISIFLNNADGKLKEHLERLIGRDLGNKGSSGEHPIWMPELFRVQDSKYFLSLNDESRASFLLDCSKLVISEAIAIEHAGVAFGHKLALLAKTTEERHLYTHLTMDELNHLYWLKPYEIKNNTMEQPNIAVLISDFIKNESREPLILLIQILLEGWGINYFRGLIEHTQNENIQNVFRNILADEFKHHASGVLLYRAENLRLDEQTLKHIQYLINSLICGPINIASMLCKRIGIENINDIKNLAESVHCLESITFSLKLIKKLLLKSLYPADIELLNLTPPENEEIAKAIANKLQL